MMQWVALVGVLAVCLGMSTILALYVCMLWFADLRVQPSDPPVDGNSEEQRRAKGMSAAELERLPGLKDGGTVDDGTECAVCLDDIETGQSARVLPECMHAFHRRCADAWLSNNAVCPLCRAVPVPND